MVLDIGQSSLHFLTQPSHESKIFFMKNNQENETHHSLNEKKGSLYAIISGLCYGLVGYFGISIMHANLSLASMLFWRFLISSLLVGLLLICSRQKINDRFSGLAKVFFDGVLWYSATAITYFISSIYIGTGLAMVIFFTYPAIIMLFNAAWCRKPIPKFYYAAIALIIIGLTFLADISELKYNMTGIGMGILSAIAYAGYILSSKKNSVSPMVSTLTVSLGCMTTAIIIALIQHNFAVPTTLNQWGNIIGMSVISTALPILLLLESLKYLSEEKASILSVTEPVFVVIFGILLLGEKINMLQTVGIIIILAGALITLLNKNITKE